MIDQNQDLVETRAALEKAQQRVADLEARLEAEAKEREKHPHWALALLDSANIGLWEWDIQRNKIAWADGTLAIYGVTHETFDGTFESYEKLVHPDDLPHIKSVLGETFQGGGSTYFIEHRLIRPDDLPHIKAVLQETFQGGGSAYFIEHRLIRPDDGSIRALKAWGYLYRDAEGKPYRLCGIIHDVTELKREEEARAVMQQQIIDTQRETLRQIGAPIIPLAANTLVMPLVGTLTPERATIVTETLLHAVTQRGAEFVILDVTGVPAVDNEVADALLRVAQAVRLLGAEVALTGMQPRVAQALVELGVDMSAFETKADLQGGIAWARKKGKR